MTTSNTTHASPRLFRLGGGSAWQTVRTSGLEIAHLAEVLSTRFPNSGGGPVLELASALERAEWQKNVPVTLSPDGQLAYRLAWSHDRSWRIGPAHGLAYTKVLDQLPTTIAAQANSAASVVTVRDSVGAFRAQYAKHAAGTHHYDLVITAAINAARLDQVRMSVEFTETTTELLRLLVETAPDDHVLPELLRRMQ